MSIKNGLALPSFSWKNLGGFTLIELLVVFSIIIIFSALILLNFQAGEQQFSLERSSHRLAQDIRRAEEMAMSLKEFQGRIPSGGYGIYFSKYVRAEEINYDIYLYADTNGNEKYNRGEEIETLSLEREVKIKEVRADGVSADQTSINFKPPDPVIAISPGGNLTIITLSLKADSAKTKNVIVNKAGLIYVE